MMYAVTFIVGFAAGAVVMLGVMAAAMDGVWRNR